MRGKTILVNAGPTYEKLDPVRFIGNYSSGKMGAAIAEEAYERGAKVIIVLGPAGDLKVRKEINRVDVVSADEMAGQTLKHFKKSDVAILAAAVADYTPESVSEHKIKKKEDELLIRLIPTVDIAARLGKIKKQGQILAGFALETENERHNAINKLKKKNLDLIVLNSLQDKGAGFRYDTNRITIIDSNNIIEDYELKSKRMVAADILDKIELML